MNASVSAAYLLVIIIWSTTPLGIIWSNESVHPTMAALLRMLIALVLGLIIIYIGKVKFPISRDAIRLYIYSSLGISVGMLLTYLSANYLSSGVISLMYGFLPIVSGLFASPILGEKKFNLITKIAMGIALTGLTLVSYDGLLLEQESWPGFVYIFIAVTVFALSSVLVKTVKININPLSTTVGALIFSIPVFTLAWIFLDGTLPIHQWQTRSLLAILYLGVLGSLVGFVAYFYVLQKLPASKVALITLAAPIFAIFIGWLFNDELITFKLIIGAGLVLIGLTLFLFADSLIRSVKKLNARH